MDGRTIAAEVRLQQWMRVIQARQESGLTIKEFCELNGLNDKTYHYWKRKLRDAACHELEAQKTQEIVEVTALSTRTERAPAAGTITIRLPNVEMEIQGDVSPGIVESVLRALKC